MKLAVLALTCMFLIACDDPGGGDQPAPPKDGGTSKQTTTSYPTKTVTVVCPWSPGGGTDRVSRFWAGALQKEFDNPFVVVNKTGGSGAVGHSAGATAKPDGHTILMGTFELSTMHWMGITDLTYENYTHLMQLNADAAAIIVKADAPWNSIADFIDHIKTNPDKVKMSGTATGGAWDLARAGMLNAAGVKVQSVIWVPTKGSAPAIVELLGGHVDAICCSVPEAQAQIDAGELKVLAVMSAERLPEYPDYATVKESNIDWVAVGWRGLMLPKETPPDVVQALLTKCDKISSSNEFKDFMKKNNFNITIRGPKDFGDFLRQQDAQWKTVIEAAGYAKKE